MAQMAIYVDSETVREIKRASRKAGLSRSEWVVRVLQREIRRKIPEEFFNLLGSWEDDRNTEEILRDIRSETTQPPRPELR